MHRPTIVLPLVSLFGFEPLLPPFNEIQEELHPFKPNHCLCYNTGAVISCPVLPKYHTVFSPKLLRLDLHALHNIVSVVAIYTVEESCN